MPLGILVSGEARGRGHAQNSDDVLEPSNTDDCGCMHLTHLCSLERNCCGEQFKPCVTTGSDENATTLQKIVVLLMWTVLPGNH